GFRNERGQGDVSQQVQSLIEISAQDLGVNSKAVISAIAIEAASKRFDLVGNLFGGARGCAFQNALGEEECQAVIVLVFGQDAALEHHAELNEGGAMVLFEEKAHTVG